MSLLHTLNDQFLQNIQTLISVLCSFYKPFDFVLDENIDYDVPFSLQIEVVPMKRIQTVLEMKPLEFKDMGPCGGFSAQYAAYCDLYGLPFREEVKLLLLAKFNLILTFCMELVTL